MGCWKEWQQHPRFLLLFCISSLRNRRWTIRLSHSVQRGTVTTATAVNCTSALPAFPQGPLLRAEIRPFLHTAQRLCDYNKLVDEASFAMTAQRSLLDFKGDIEVVKRHSDGGRPFGSFSCCSSHSPQIFVAGGMLHLMTRVSPRMLVSVYLPVVTHCRDQQEEGNRY
jgi:hypothetical protein